MENPEEWLAQRRITTPACEAHAESYTRSQFGPMGQDCIGRKDPDSESQACQTERYTVQAIKRRWCRSIWILLHEPIACEARNDAAANEADQHEESSETEAVAERGSRGKPYGFGMHEAITYQQKAKCAQHPQVAPVPSGQDLTCHNA